MSIFSTLESSSFHNSIPNLMYVSRRFCIHVILSWRPKNCTGALKNWNLGEKKPVYCLSLISKSYNLSSFEPSLMHVQEGVFKLLYWPNNACSVDWLIYQPTDRCKSIHPFFQRRTYFIWHVPTYWCTFCLWPNLLECCIPDILAAFCQFLKVKLHWYGYTDKWSQNYNFYNIYYTIYLSIWVCTHSLV